MLRPNIQAGMKQGNMRICIRINAVRMFIFEIVAPLACEGEVFRIVSSSLFRWYNMID